MLPPVVAWLVQWLGWAHLRPLVWLLFFPAVFISSWIGGLTGGLVATAMSVVIVVRFFISPELSFAIGDSQALLSIAMFVGMGVLFSVFQGRLRRAAEAAAGALRTADQANERVRERTAELEIINVALREREQLFSDAFRLSPDCMVMVRVSDRSVVLANEAMGRLWGAAPDQMVGRPTQDYTQWISEEERLAFMQTLHEKGECLNYETHLRVNDGRLVPFVLSSRMIVLNGEPCVLSVMRDLTERRRAEEAHRRIAAIVESSDDAIVGKDLTGRVTDWNAGAEKIFGYTAAEMMGTPILRLIPPDRRVEEDRIMAQIARGEPMRHFETVRCRKDGSLIDVSVTVSPIREADGRVVGASKIARDISERKRTERALRETRERLAGVAASSPGVLCSMRMGPDGVRTFDYAAPGIEGIFGVTAEELMRDPTVAFDRIDPTDRRGIREAITESVRSLSPLRYRFRVAHPTEGLIWVEGNSAVGREPDGQVVWHGVMTDVTAETRAQEALRESEARYRTLFECAPDGILIATPEGVYLDANARICQMLGRTRAELVGLDATSILEPSETPRIAPTLKVIYTNADYHGEWTFRRKDGSLFEAEVMASPIPGGNLLAMIRDVTDRRNVERALREKDLLLYAADRRLAEIVHGMTEACFALDREWRFIFVNERGAALSGHNRAELMGRSVWEVFPELVGTPLEQHYRHAMTARVSVAVEVYSSVSLRWMDIRLFPTGEGIAAFLLDISERKRSEEEREKLARLIEHSRDFIALADLTGGVTFMNAGGRDMIGLPADRDLRTVRFIEYVPEGGRAFFENTVLPIVRERGIWEGEMQLRHMVTGAIIEVFRSTFLIHDGAGEPLCYATVTRNITDEKQATEKLASERNLLRTLFDLLPDYVYVKDRECRFLACNDRCATRFGLLSSQLLLGKTDADLFPAEVAGPFREEDLAVLRGDAVIDREEAYTRPDGVTEIISTTKVPLWDGNGEIVGIVGCGRDITNRKRDGEAIRRLNAELEQRVVERTAELKDANRELEAFSYSVSHDLRAPLRAVDGFSLALLEDFGAQLPPEGRRQIQTIRTSAQRMGELIDDLLTFSRLSRQALSRQATNIDRLVRSVLTDFTAECSGRQVEFQVGELPAGQGDPRLLRQVWVNLVSNALKYTRRRSPAVIEIGAVREAGETVYFIRDNGSGFDMRYANKLFGVFQRLHRAEDYEGTGVGLAIVQRVIHRHGGRVWAEAAVDRGAAFFFTLEPKAGA